MQVTLTPAATYNVTAQDGETTIDLGPFRVVSRWEGFVKLASTESSNGRMNEELIVRMPTERDIRRNRDIPLTDIIEPSTVEVLDGTRYLMDTLSPKEREAPITMDDLREAAAAIEGSPGALSGRSSLRSARS